MTRMHRALATVAFVALIVIGLVPPSPSNAVQVDLFRYAPTGWTAAGNTGAGSSVNSGCTDTGGFAHKYCDSNDATGAEGNTGGGTNNCSVQTVHGTSRTVCEFSVGWTRSSGVTDFEISAIRLLAGYCASGWPHYSSCGSSPRSSIYGVLVTTGGSGTDPCHLTGSPTENLWLPVVSAGPVQDTGIVNLDTPITIASGDRIRICVANTDTVTSWGSRGDFVVWSAELYDEPTGPEEVLITEYLYGLRLDHPPFERVIYWEWARDDCGGSWSIVDQDDEVFGGDFLNCAGDFIGQYERFVIECPVVCGHDVYTITINDTTNNRVAFYEIDSDESGELIADSTAPVITSFTACYNASTDQCVGERPDLYTAQAAGTLQTTYSFTGDPVNATFGHDDPTQGLWWWSGTPSTLDAQTEGWYRRTFTSVDEDLSPTFNLYMENFATEYDWSSFTVDYSAGGHIEIPVDDGPPTDEGDIRNCSGPFGLELVACRIGQLVDVLTATFASVVHNLWGPAISAMRAAAAEKLPFAYIVLAVDGVGAQLARAAAEVDNSDDCEGIVLNVPLAYGSSNLSASPSPFPINVLRCDQLEPVMGTTWYQAVRVALDPALWLLFAWSQFKALQPRTSLNG